MASEKLISASASSIDWYSGYPAIAGLKNGGFALAYQDSFADGMGVAVKVFDSYGNQTVSQIQADSFTSGTQSKPVIAGLDNGNFVVSWQSSDQENSSYGIYAQLFSAAGKKLGSEIHVNTYTTNDQYLPSIAAFSAVNQDPAGFVVAWNSVGQDGLSNSLRYKKYYVSGSGISVVGQESQLDLSQDDWGSKVRPEITVLSNGDLAARWYGPIHGDNGVVIKVNGTASFRSEMYDPAIAALDDGYFVTAAVDIGTDANITVTKFDSNGNSVEKITANTYTKNSQRSPAIAKLIDNTFIVAWNSDYQDGDESGVYAQHFDASLAKIGPEFRVNDTIEGDQLMPQIAPLSDGGYVISWGAGKNVFAKRYNAADIAQEITTIKQTPSLIGFESIHEGSTARFTLSKIDAISGTTFTYKISGVSAADIVGGVLSGTTTVSTDGTALISVPITEDKTTEGSETLTVTVQNVSASTLIHDTSTGRAATPSYTLIAPESSVTEGGDAEFLLETTGVAVGTVVNYKISGVSAADLTSRQLTGSTVVGANGTAVILISTATDTLIEGTENLIMTIKGQAAQVALLDESSIKVSSIIATGIDVSLYKVNSGSYVLAADGLSVGDTLGKFISLRANAIKDYLPKSVLAVLSYDDGSYGLISSGGTASKPTYSEQAFSAEGIAKGKTSKLTLAQLLPKETISQTDLNNDGVIGDIVTAVVDSDGDTGQQDYGLYKMMSGSIVLAATELTVGDVITESMTLMVSKTRSWTVPTGAAMKGIAFTDSGDLELLTLRGTQFSAHKFDPETGLIKGKATTLKAVQVEAREYYYNLDLTGDGDISLVGQETVPVGWVA